MKLVYQWIAWAYSHQAAQKIEKFLNCKIHDIIWVNNFSCLWENITDDCLWIIPIENSYAWNIHENMYHFLRYDYKIIACLDLEIHHCLLSLENDISKITEVYSHPQALSQCHNFLQKHNIKPIAFWDTAGSAQMIYKKQKKWVWALASNLAWDIYNLNKISQSVQDQTGNTTRFFVIAPKKSDIISQKKENKVSLLFEAQDIPSNLYKCLWAFATQNINLTKIESLPSLKDPFSYMFWIDFEGNIQQKNVQLALKELAFFTKNISILWEY